MVYFSLQILWQVDTILFSLLILRGLSDSQGRVWRCHPNQLYAVEVTLPLRDHIPEQEKKVFPESRTLSLLSLLPSVTCLSPRKALEHPSAEHTGMFKTCIAYFKCQKNFLVEYPLRIT